MREKLEEIYNKYKDYFELNPSDVTAEEIDVSPLYASTFVDLLETVSGEPIEVLPAHPYFDYPFKPARNILEYVAYRVKREPSPLLEPGFYKVVEEIDETRITNPKDQEYLYKLLGAYLGHRYVYYISEGGDGSFDKIILFDSDKVKEAIDKLLETIDKLEPELRNMEDQERMAEKILEALARKA